MSSIEKKVKNRLTPKTIQLKDQSLESEKDGMPTGKAEADSHCWDIQCQRRRRVQGLPFDEDEDVGLLELQRLVHEPHLPVQLSCVSRRSDVMQPSS